MPDITEPSDPAEVLARQIIRISFVLRTEYNQPGITNLSAGQREIMDDAFLRRGRAQTFKTGLALLL